MTFGEKLKELREGNGWSQQALADAAGVSVWAIRDYEQGKRRFDPGLNLLVRVSRALGVSMDVFAACVETEGNAGAGRKPRKARKKKG